MKPLLMDEIRRIIRGRWLTQHDPVSIESVTTDSRSVQGGEVFFALRGDRYDGHNFLESAAKAGCSAAVVRFDAPQNMQIAKAFPGGIVGVEDTLTALGAIAAHNRKHTAASVIAVTGSNGKTTVKRMIHAVLSETMSGSCSPKSFNNNIGVPLTLLGVEPPDDYVVCEIGTNHPGEIGSLSRIAGPDLAVITSVGATHLEGLGTVDDVAREKASILGFLSDDGLGIVNADSEALEMVLRAYENRKLIRFGEHPEADLRLTGYESNGFASHFQVNDRLWIDLPLPGKHNAVNALAALAVGQRFGMKLEQAAEALSRVEPAPMRMQPLHLSGGTLINDAYNANPASMLAAAEVLVNINDNGRKVFICGDMGELGEDSHSWHRRLGLDLACRGVDLLIGVGPLGRYVAEEAASHGAGACAFGSLSELSGAIPSLLKTGDTVLIKASRSVALENLVEPIRRALGEDVSTAEQGI